MKCKLSLTQQYYRNEEDIQVFKQLGFKFEKGFDRFSKMEEYVLSDRFTHAETGIEINSISDLLQLIKNVDSDIIISNASDENCLYVEIYNGWRE